MRGLVTVKVGFAIVASLAFNVVGWAGAVIYQLAQVDATTVSDSPVTVFSATALTGTAGVLGYVVRQMASGKLVHRDPATAEKRLVDALDRLTRITETSLKREETLYRLFVNERGKSGRVNNDDDRF